MTRYPVGNVMNWAGINWVIAIWFSDVDTANVWVDDDEALHMVTKKTDGVWSRMEIDDPTTRLYGRFTWSASTSLLNLERNTSIGLFTYYTDGDEIDIEINQWPGYDQHVFFSNQPSGIDTHEENMHYGVLTTDSHLDATNVTYIIEWTPAYIYYAVIGYDGHIIIDWTYNDGDGTANIPSEYSSLCMDIMPLANTYFPVEGTNFEIVFSNYEYNSMVLDASFATSSTNSNCATQFTDSSTGLPATWAWDFGDGSTSTKVNPIHRFLTTGTHSVTLTVSNAVSSDTVTQSVVVS